MADHAVIGPSALHRLLACPGSYRLSTSRPEKGSSVYAAEGTVAHTICETCLTDPARGPKDFLGDTLSSDGFDFIVDDEMVSGCEDYVSHCRSLIDAAATRSWHQVEVRVSLDGLWAPGAPPEPIFGTADFVLFDPDASHLYVCDFKYGRGDVDPEENAQAQAYALGAVLTFGILPRIVDIYIVQPRAQNRAGVKHWRTSGLDLMAWGVDELKAGVARLLDVDAPYIPGDHCKFCPGLAVCPALRKLARDTARTEFEPVPPGPETLTNDELGDIMRKGAILKSWLDAVQAEVSQRIDRGQIVPGWKLVPKRATRTWADKAKAERWAASHAPSIFKQVLETPTQVQKKDPDAYEAMVEEGLVDATSSGTTLVPDDDPRDALVQKRAKDEFSAV